VNDWERQINTPVQIPAANWKRVTYQTVNIPILFNQRAKYRCDDTGDVPAISENGDAPREE
jgi:hypothetical protein